MPQQTRQIKASRDERELGQFAGDDAGATPLHGDQPRANGFFRGLSAAVGGSILVWVVIYLCVEFMVR